MKSHDHIPVSQLTEQQIDEIAAIYPTTRNGLICEKYNLSDTTLFNLHKKYGWSKTKVKRRKRSKALTEEQVTWIRENYSRTSNREICETLGIRKNRLLRVRTMYGLEKDDDYKAAVFRENADKAQRASSSILRGKSYEELYGKERAAEIRRKILDKQAETYRRERLRIRWGLPQQTKMKLGRASQKVYYIRHQLKKKGYIVQKGYGHVYFDDNSRRSLRMEENAVKYGMLVSRLPDSEAV